MARKNLLAARVKGWGALFLLVVVLCGTSARSFAADTPKEAAEDRVARLIAQLGSEQFATRERAQAELERLGLIAFDALQEALQHDDVEIQLRARYLLRVMPISWVREGDSQEVRNVLRNYGEQPENDRRARLEKLSKLEGGVGAASLCRLARFETSNTLSRYAAILAMNVALPNVEAVRTDLARVISTIAGGSKRPSMNWLRAYAETLTQPVQSLATWKRITQDEFDSYRQSPDPTALESLRDLLHWHIDLLRNQNRNEEAMVAVRRSLQLLDGGADGLLDAVNWLLARDFDAMIPELAQQHRGEFQRSSHLLYRLAEAHRRQKNETAANTAAEHAFRLNQDDAEAQLEIGVELEDRGLFDWAERAFRQPTKLAGKDNPEHVRGLFKLSEMFHDMHKELAAAQTLQELVDAMQKDANLEKRIEDLPIREPSAFRARMHYFYAQHYLEQKDLASHVKHLEEAIGADPKDADVLIAMFRVPNPTEEFRARTKRLIWETARGFHDDVDKFERVVADRNEDQQRNNDLGGWLAMLCNQYAWLVGNTEGDYREALRCSRRSLELKPGEAGYMDTLGRCYYAVSDFENAVKWQSQAVKLKPHSGQIRRQLELFEKALAGSLNGTGEGAAKSAPSGDTK